MAAVVGFHYDVISCELGRKEKYGDRRQGMSSNSHVAENGRECDYMFRAALTGKHDTLVRTAPGWQGAPDGQQAKQLVVTKCLFYIINVLI